MADWQWRPDRHLIPIFTVCTALSIQTTVLIQSKCIRSARHLQWKCNSNSIIHERQLNKLGTGLQVHKLPQIRRSQPNCGQYFDFQGHMGARMVSILCSTIRGHQSRFWILATQQRNGRISNCSFLCYPSFVLAMGYLDSYRYCCNRYFSPDQLLLIDSSPHRNHIRLCRCRSRSWWNPHCRQAFRRWSLCTTH